MQLGRSYTGRLLVNVEISVRQTVNGQVVHQYSADVRDLCVGEFGSHLSDQKQKKRVLPGFQFQYSLAPFCVIGSA
jgi:hypothetical protein